MKIIRHHPFIINLLLLLLAIIASVAIGAVAISPEVVVRVFLAKLPGITFPVDWAATTETIIFRVRLPHTILILLTGAALASSGAAYQGLFRNPLADPYLIGVASGAGLGAVIAMSRSWRTDWLGLYAIPFAAFLAALVTVAIVYMLARTGKTIQTTTLILAGVAVSSFATALTSYLMLRSNAEMQRALGWLLGGGMLAGWAPVLAILPYMLVGLGTLLFLGHPLNVLQFGDDQAQQMGLSVERLKANHYCDSFIDDGGGGGFLGHYRLCRVDCAAFDSHDLGAGLSPVSAAVHHWRGDTAAAGRHYGAGADGAASAALGYRHSHVWRTLFLMDFMAIQV